MEKRTKKKHPVGSRTKNLRGTDGAKDEGAPRRKPNEESPWNEWSHGQRRTPQEAARRPSVERMEPRITTHPAGSRTTPLRGTDGAKDNEEPPWNGWSQGQRIIYVERMEIRIEKNALNDMFLSIFSGRMPNNALQRTPLARPLTWARLFGRVAHRRSSRFTEVTSGAAESRRWAVVRNAKPSA